MPLRCSATCTHDTEMTLHIRRFEPSDQANAERLINTNLRQRFGALDPNRNPDLVDIARHYRDDDFLVAVSAGQIVGTGALIIVDSNVGRIERMHVDDSARRRGIARRLLEELETTARHRGLKTIVLETTIGWHDAERFYRASNFVETHRAGDEVHFKKTIAPA